MALRAEVDDLASNRIEAARRAQEAEDFWWFPIDRYETGYPPFGESQLAPSDILFVYEEPWVAAPEN